MASLTDSLSSTPLGELVTFRAFDYKPDDVSESLARRFRGRQLLLVSISTRQLKVGLASFDAQGVGRIEPGVQIMPPKAAGALTDHLKSVVRTATRGSTPPWVVVTVSQGWTAEVVRMAFHGTDQERMERLREFPEDVVGKPLSTSCEHAVVPHPMLEASVLFSTRSSVLVDVLDAIKAAGLQVARIQNSIASMVEAYVNGDPDGAQARDLLVYDEQGVMLLLVENKDWKKIRFRCTSPETLTGDIIKFMGEERPDATAPLTVLGRRSAMLEQILRETGTPSTLICPFEEQEAPEFTAAVCAESEGHLAHDLNPERQAPRPPLPKTGRMAVIGYMLAALTVTGLIVGNVVAALSRQSMRDNIVAQDQQETNSANAAEAEWKRYQAEVERADEIAEWVRIGYNPQQLLLGIIRSLPDSVVLVNIEAKMEEGNLQMSLAVTLDGVAEAQTAGFAAIEATMDQQDIRVINREVSGSGGRAVTTRLTLLIPAAGEVIIHK